MADKNQNIEPAATTTELDETANDSTESLAKPEEQQAGALGTPEDDALEAQLAYEALKKRKKAKRRKRRIIIAVVAVLVLLVGFLVVSGNNSNDAQEKIVETAFATAATARKGAFEATVGGTGKAEPISQSVVSPEVSGIIENLNVEVGQNVNEGDVLFHLKNSELDTDVAKKQLAVDTAQRARDTSERKLNEAIITREDAWNKANDSDDWSTYNELALSSAIDDAVDTLNNSEGTLAAAIDDLSRAQEMADKRNVTAPITGSVVAVNATNGQSVGGATGGTTGGAGSGATTNNGPLVQIADTAKMKVAVQINEVDIEQVATDQPAKATFQAIPDLVQEAKVQSIATVSTGSSSNATGGADSGSTGGGVVTYRVDLVVPNDNNKIKPGMSASVTIVTKHLDNALVVPAATVFGADMGNAHVLKVTDTKEQKYVSVPVKIVEQSTSEMAIEGDVTEGDRLLTQDLDSMQSLLSETDM